MKTQMIDDVEKWLKEFEDDWCEGSVAAKIETGAIDVDDLPKLLALVRVYREKLLRIEEITGGVIDRFDVNSIKKITADFTALYRFFNELLQVNKLARAALVIIVGFVCTSNDSVLAIYLHNGQLGYSDVCHFDQIEEI